MKAVPFRWSEIESDHPIALLHRKSIHGEKSLVARVTLEPGCHVAPHHHDSEQIAIVLSGKVVWSLGDPGGGEVEKLEMSGGEVLHLPSRVWHGVDALELTEIIDILSPPGPMGVDRQRDGAH